MRHHSDAKNIYPPVDPFHAGLSGCCPRCGQGKAITGLLNIKDRCSACQLDLTQFEVGDGPQIFVILIANLVIMGLALWVEFSFGPPLWLHAILWLPATILICVACMRFFKGMLLAQQYKMEANQGKIVADE